MVENLKSRISTRPHSQRFCDVARTVKSYYDCDVAKSLRMGPTVAVAISLATSNLTCRYTKVKYNDLVSQDANTRHNVTRALFEFIGIPFSKEVADNVDNFRSGRGERSYFNVYRPDDYNPDHWEEQIQQQVIGLH